MHRAWSIRLHSLVVRSEIMQNAPLKVACWVMVLAFAMTVVLTSITPRSPRVAANRVAAPQEKNVTDSFTEGSVNSTPEAWVPEPVTAADSRAHQVTPEIIANYDKQALVSLLQEQATAAPSPVRVASRDFAEIPVETAPQAVVEVSGIATPPEPDQQSPLCQLPQTPLAADAFPLAEMPATAAEQPAVPSKPYPTPPTGELSQHGRTQPISVFLVPEHPEPSDSADYNAPVPEPVDLPALGASLHIEQELQNLQRELQAYQLEQARREFETLKHLQSQRSLEQVNDEIRQLHAQLKSLKRSFSNAETLADSGESIAAPNPPCPPAEETSASTAEVAAVPVPSRSTAETRVASLTGNPFQSEDNSTLVEASEHLESPPASGSKSSRESTSISKIEAASQTGMYHFEFQNAELQEVLVEVGKLAGWNITCLPDVQGVCTVRLTETEPRQAFATLIKLHGLGLSYRGSFLLVRGERSPHLR